jgi:hypothetical protein
MYLFIDNNPRGVLLPGLFPRFRDGRFVALHAILILLLPGSSKGLVLKL